MKYLLDTHAFLWWIDDDKILSRKAHEIISNSGNMIFVSAASTWELSIKKSLGKLNFSYDFEEEIEKCNFKSLSITAAHTVFTGTLPRYHNDPFDRIIIAQALVEGLKIITRDQKIQSYQVPIILA